jgi:hypothetical protein
VAVITTAGVSNACMPPNVVEMCRRLSEIHDMVSRTCVVVVNATANRALRIKFLEGSITEATWRKVVHQRTVDNEWRTANMYVFDLLMTVAGDVVRRVRQIVEQRRLSADMSEVAVMLTAWRTHMAVISDSLRGYPASRTYGSSNRGNRSVSRNAAGSDSSDPLSTLQANSTDTATFNRCMTTMCNRMYPNFRAHSGVGVSLPSSTQSIAVQNQPLCMPEEADGWCAEIRSVTVQCNTLLAGIGKRYGRRSFVITANLVTIRL